jgi:hypothetical protein
VRPNGQDCDFALTDQVVALGLGVGLATLSHTTDQTSARFLQARARRAFWLRTKQGDRVAFCSSVECKKRDIFGVDPCHRMKGYLGQYGEAYKLS